MPSCGTKKKMAAGGAVDKNKRSYDGGIYTAEMGPPPFDIDMGSSPKPTKKELEARKITPAPAPKKLKEMPRDLMPEDFEKMKKDKKKMAKGGDVVQDDTTSVTLIGGGGGNKYGVGGGGRLSLNKEISKNSAIQAYIDASGYKPKEGKMMGGVSGGGISYNRRFAAGGSVTTPKQQAKVGKVMKEFKAGSLHSGPSGKVVKSPKQAVAIALSEARKIKK